MVTVKQFLDAGFKFVVGDKVNNCGADVTLRYEHLLDMWNERSEFDESCFVNDLAWRVASKQPVGNDCYIRVEQANGVVDSGYAGEFDWTIRDDGNEIIKWIPELSKIGNKMNDIQETKTALEMSERDIENYSDNCDVERELKKSDEVTWENGDLCLVERLEGRYQFGCYVPNSDLVIAFNCESGHSFTINKDRLSKPLPVEEKAGRDLFYLSIKANNKADEGGWFGDWSKASERDKKYWIEFANLLGFTTGI